MQQQDPVHEPAAARAAPCWRHPKTYPADHLLVLFLACRSVCAYDKQSLHTHLQGLQAVMLVVEQRSVDKLDELPPAAKAVSVIKL